MTSSKLLFCSSWRLVCYRTCWRIWWADWERLLMEFRGVISSWERVWVVSWLYFCSIWACCIWIRESTGVIISCIHSSLWNWIWFIVMFTKCVLSSSSISSSYIKKIFAFYFLFKILNIWFRFYFYTFFLFLNSNGINMLF